MLVNNLNLVDPPVTSFNALITSGRWNDFGPSSEICQQVHHFYGSGILEMEAVPQIRTPTHTYSIPGSFTVNLTVWNAGGVNFPGKTQLH